MANNNNEKENRNKAAEPQNGKAPAPRKKLNVVFRKQNSTSIKELPKGLKKAADGSTDVKAERGRKPEAGQQRRPRPLPAGTKPVRPALKPAARDEAEAPGKKVVKAPAEKPAAAPVQEENKEVLLKTPEKAAQSAVTEVVKETKETAAEPKAAAVPAPVLKAGEPAKTEETGEKAGEAGEGPEKAAEKPDEIIKQPAAEMPEEIKEQPDTVKPAAGTQEEKKAESVSKKEEKPEKKPETAEKAVSVPEAPRVKIVKSYANYDVAAIIAEASRKNKKENSQKTQKRPQPGGQKTGQAGSAGFKTQQAGNADKKTGTKPFSQRSQAAPGQGAARPQGGAQPFTNKRTAPAGQAPAAGRSFDQTQGKGQHQRKGTYQGKDNRKDKYVDDLAVKGKAKNLKGAFIKPEPKKDKPEEEIKVIIIPETLTIKELSDKMRLQPSVIVKKLFLEGKMVTPNTDLSYEEAEEIAMEYDILCEREVEEDVIAGLLKDDEDDEERMVARNPVVCVMGHVDHGKTSLLDAIRNTNVTSHEAGGITQHIGASVVKAGDRHITFLDTPGHEAFTAMRLRGAQSTDIAVLVVAADDGVKPQTVEAINHAKAAQVEVIVAINKMDKPSANPDMVRKELADYGLISEEWGGSTPMVEVSAKTGAGISDLLDMILLEADVMELRADPKRRARGLVIEAQLDKGRGPVATVLVQKGTLKVGDYVVAGESFGRVRAMVDDKHGQIKQAPPSYPAEILGLSDVPNAGEVFMVCKNEHDAKDIANAFIAEHKKHMIEETKKKMNLDDLFDEIKAGNIKELPIIVKADVQGSVEAVKQSLGKLSNEEVAVKVIHSAAGNINESDVSLASASNAIIIGFNVKPDPLAKAQAEQEKIDMRLYKVIYQAIDDLNAALTGMLAPVYEAQVTGHAVVRQTFRSSGVGIIAGCYVTDGVVEKGSRARLTRGGKQLFDGDIASLKRFKDEVKEVKLGFECGIVLEDFSDIEVDDALEIYKMVQVPRT